MWTASNRGSKRRFPRFCSGSPAASKEWCRRRQRRWVQFTQRRTWKWRQAGKISVASAQATETAVARTRGTLWRRWSGRRKNQKKKKQPGYGPENLWSKQPGRGPQNLQKKQTGRGPGRLFNMGSVQCMVWRKDGEALLAGWAVRREAGMWTAVGVMAGWRQEENGKVEEEEEQEETEKGKPKEEEKEKRMQGVELVEGREGEEDARCGGCGRKRRRRGWQGVELVEVVPGAHQLKYWQRRAKEKN